MGCVVKVRRHIGLGRIMPSCQSELMRLHCVAQSQMRRVPHWMDWKRSSLEASVIFHILARLKCKTDPP